MRGEYYAKYRGFPGLTVKHVRSEAARRDLSRVGLAFIFREGADQPIAEFSYWTDRAIGEHCNVWINGTLVASTYGIGEALAVVCRHFQLGEIACLV